MKKIILAIVFVIIVINTLAIISLFVYSNSQCQDSCQTTKCKKAQCVLTLTGSKCITETIYSCCGNSICEPKENGTSCKEDCFQQNVCGNAICEKNENSCTCEQDCGICQKEEGCKKYLCEKGECVAKIKQLCCPNTICEEGETAKTCSQDCQELENGEMKTYKGADIVTKPCTAGPCEGGCCDIGYLPFGQYGSFSIEYYLYGIFDTQLYEGIAEFSFYVKASPEETASLKVYVNGEKIGKVNLPTGDWGTSSFGFEWEKITFNTNILKKDKNTLVLESNDWFAVAMQDGQYMTKLKWEKTK